MSGIANAPDVQLEVSDLEIGAVEIKNATDDTRAKVGVASGIAESDNALAVQAPVLGVTTGAAVTTNANGTVQQYLRGLIALIVAKIGITVAAGDNVTEGNTSDAAIVTDTTGTLSGKLRGLVKWAFERMPAALGQGTMAQSLPVVLASNQSTVGVTPAATESHLGEVGGKMVTLSVEITRPADTAPYSALDVYSDSTSSPTVAQIANFSRVNGGSGTITKVRLMTDLKTCVAGFRIHFFHTTPTAVNDNAAYPVLYANKANRVGSLDVSSLKTEDPTTSTAAYGHNYSDWLDFVLAAGSRTLFLVPEILTGFTPASGQKLFVEVTARLD